MFHPAPLLAAALVTGPLAHRALLRREAHRLTPCGVTVPVAGHSLHIYREGAGPGPTLVFLSGGGTPAPVYDFRPLYRLLSPTHPVAVVEKPGYGYAPSCAAPRDVETLLSETRQALSAAGCPPPYVLFPHSYSGLEALCWAARYPEELWAIVGLDMAVPEVYDCLHIPAPVFSLLGAAAWLGIPRLTPRPKRPCLTLEEARQERMLTARNLYAPSVLAEANAAWSSAKHVSGLLPASLPMLLFLSDGKEVGPFWLPCQEAYAGRRGAETVHLNCGHYVHQHAAPAIARRTEAFLRPI